MRTVLRATGIGVAVTALLMSFAYAAHGMGFEMASHMLFWQNTLLQSLCPIVNIGTPEHPVYEGTPLNTLAFLASVPIGVGVYSAVAYFVLRSRRDGEQ